MSFNLGLLSSNQLKQLASYQAIYSEEKAIVQPFHWYLEGKETSPWEVTIPEAFVVTLEEGVLFAENDVQAIATSSGKLVGDLSHSWRIPSEKHPILERESFPPLVSLDKTVVVLNTPGAGLNFYHWMIDLLPRIDLLRKSGLSPDKYYLPTPLFPFQKETLEKIGIHEDDCLYPDQFPYLKAKQLIIPSLAAKPFKVPIPRWAIDFLRNQFLPHEISTPTERIYISREKAKSRRIVNESELTGLLSQKGFKKVVLENLAVEEQAKLFASASTIVCVHGAALTNLVFCSRPSHVVEIFHPQFTLHCFFSLCNQLGIIYSTIMAQKAGQEGDFDVSINLSELEKLL